MSDHLEIAALGARHNKTALANSAIAAGKSLDQFRSELLEELSDLPISSYGPDYLAPVERSFSLTRLIHAEVTNDWSRAGYEREMCQEAARSYKGKARGLIVPASALASRASMNMAGTAAGSVGETLLGDAYIDALRPASYCVYRGDFGRVKFLRVVGSHSEVWGKGLGFIARPLLALGRPRLCIYPFLYCYA